MALPEFVVRSYGGGAEPAQLVQPIGATDTTFTIVPTTGWVETAGANLGAALGTSGPFCVVIDRFTDTVEKILCSSVNLTTGVVTVDTSGGSGRGYDGSTAQAHVPGGSTSGVQTTWSSVEAYEANQVVATLLGGSPSTGQIVQWNGTKPVYADNVAGVTGVPSGRIYYTTTSGTLTTGTYQIDPVTSEGLVGGVTFNSGDQGLVVPTTGRYQIDAQVVVAASGQGQFDCIVSQNGSQLAAGAAATPAVSTITPAYNGIRGLTAGDVVTFSIAIGAGVTGVVSGGPIGGTSELSLVLVSA